MLSREPHLCHCREITYTVGLWKRQIYCHTGPHQQFQSHSEFGDDLTLTPPNNPERSKLDQIANLIWICFNFDHLSKHVVTRSLFQKQLFCGWYLGPEIVQSWLCIWNLFLFLSLKIHYLVLEISSKPPVWSLMHYTLLFFIRTSKNQIKFKMF